MKYFHTLRHLKPVQVTARALAPLRKRTSLLRAPAPPEPLEPRLEPLAAFCHHDAWNTREAILDGTFRFLNRTERLGRPVDWKAPGLPLLWQFNLHYFDYLFLLEPAEREALCAEWVRRAPPGDAVAWHPYPTSLRISNWCAAAVADPGVVQSLYAQAAYLSRNLERYHPGNHLLENARALVLAGTLFRGQGEANAWLERGLEVFRQETPVQVLSDGGSFERSPMYHALVLEGYLDVLNVVPADTPGRELLADAARRMADFLASVTHPDGNIALFNDSTREVAPPTGALLEYAVAVLGRGASVRTAFAETGYFIHRGPAVYLIVDGGPVGPDHLPAHAHADIFSYELSLFGEPFVVDAGVFEYAEGEMRSYVRSTPAHNTVCVDRTDQAECWKSFRVARRFPPTGVSFQRSALESRFEGRFDGYGALVGDGIEHVRTIECSDERREIAVLDTVRGAGVHRVESSIHLHPEVSVEGDANRMVLSRGGARCVLDVDGAGARRESGWYCPEFGLRQRNTVLVVGGELPLAASLSYRFTY